MNCAIHTSTQATAYCRTCGKAMCPACQHNVRGVIYCEPCLAERLGQAAPPPPPPGVAPGVPPGMAPPVVPVVPVMAEGSNLPSPGLAAFLGFIPGVGAIYNGQFVKGLAHVAIFIAIIWATNQVDWFGFLIPVWIFYMVFDAYKTARARELGQPLPDPFGFESLWEGGRRAYSAPAPGSPPVGFTASGATEPGDVASSAEVTCCDPCVPRAGAAPVGAIVLIVLGLIFLLNSWTDLWWVHRVINRVWLPAALIFLGIWIFVRKRSRPWSCPCSRCQARYLMGPALLITTGALWLLSDWSPWRFHESWPIYLIVIGGIMVIRHTASEEGHVPYSERLDTLGRHVDARIASRMERREAGREFFRERVENRDAARDAAQQDQPASANTNDEVHNG